jgi:Ger(x)C family germination protein
MFKYLYQKYSKHLLTVLGILLLTATTSGCNDSKDINEKLILTAIAFDLQDDEIIGYSEFARISKSSGNYGSGSTEYITVRSRGKTLAETRYNLELQVDKPVFYSGVRAIIFTESFAKQYLVEYLYRYRADESLRKKIETVITMDDPDKIFRTIQDKKESIGFTIEGLIESLDDSGRSFSRTTIRLIENISSKYSGVLISCIGLEEKQIILTGYSVLDNNNITGFIPVEESKALVFLKADKPKLNYTIPYQDMEITIEVALKKRKVKASYENGRIGFNLNLDFKAELAYGNRKTPYNFEEAAIDEMTEILTERLTKEFYYVIEQAQKELEADYLQFDDEFRIRYPAAFENMDWKSEFPNSKIAVSVNVELTTTYVMDYGAVDVK